MSREGYILLHRQMLDSFVFQNPHYLKLWIYCLMKAAYKEEALELAKYKLRLLPGQFVWGRDAAATELNCGLKKNEQKTGAGWNHMLKVLESKEMVQRQNYQRFTLVTVVNYVDYQKKESAVKAAAKPATDSIPAENNPYTMYQKAYAKPLTPVITQSITEWTNTFGGQGALVAYAIQLAGLNGAQSPRYFEAVLRIWQKKGIQTLAEAEDFTREFEVEKERKMSEKLERQAEERQLAQVPEEELPSLSTVNWLVTEG